MFGKKKKSDVAGESAASAEATSTPSKSKSAKPRKQQSLKGGPNVVVAHFEKVALLGIAGLAGFLAYSSFSKPGLQSSQEPKKLADQAGQLLTQVKENHWEAIAPERQKFVSGEGKFQKDVEEARKPVEDSSFAKLKRLEPRTGPDVIEPRKDPVIYPVQDIEVKFVPTTIAVAVANPEDNVDQFKTLDDADPIPVKGRNRERRNDNNQESESAANLKPKRRLKATYDLGFTIAGLGAGMGEGSGMGSGPGMGGPGMGGPGMGSGGEGMGSGGMGGGAAGGAAGGGLGEGPKGPTHRIGSLPVYFNSITALIPHKKIFEEYHKTFVNTGTFNPMRDVPMYLGLEVQRVDVTGDEYREIKENEWKTILTNREIADMPLDMFKEKNTKQPTSAWATHYPREKGKTRLGSPIPEVIDPRAVLPGLTAPIPPVLIRDYREFSKHSAIDWRWNSKVKRAAKKKDPGSEGGSAEDDVSFDNQQGAGGMGSGMSGMGGMGSGMGSMGSGYGGEDGGYGGEGGFGEGGYGDEGGMGPGMGPGMGGMGSGMGSGMGGAGGMGAMLPENQPEFKMIRTYDFLSKKDFGKVFRYRMRVMMRDPNYPENQDYSKAIFKSAHTQLPPPQNRELHHDVYDRITKLRATDDKIIEENKAKKIYKARTMRQTEWSLPSPPVRFTMPTEAFAGDVMPTAGGISAKVVVTQLSANAKFPGAILAAEVTADRGAVLGQSNDGKKPLEIIAPTNQLIKKIENQSVLPGHVVIDIRGGQSLAGSVGNPKDDPLQAMGELMLLRSDGSIIMSNTFDDQFLYRMYSFQDDIEAAKKAAATGAGAGGGMGGMGSGGFGGGEEGT